MEILTSKTEHAPADLKNLTTRDRSVHWIKAQLKQRRNLLYNSKLRNSRTFINKLWALQKRQEINLYA